MMTIFTRITITVGIALGGLGCSGDEYDSGCPGWVGAEHYLACPKHTRPKCAEEATPFQGDLYVTVHAWCETKSSKERHGPHRARYNNGAEAFEGWYCNGLACGIHFGFWPDHGQASQFPACLGLGGAACGVSRTWHEDGTPQHKADYRLDGDRSVICGTETEWDEQGAVIKETQHTPCADYEVCPASCACDCL